MTSFFHDLEEQLRAAAHERTSGLGAPSRQKPPRRGRRRRWLADGARLVPVAVAVAVTLAVVGGALVLLGHRGGQPPTPPASGGPGNAFAALVQKTPKAQLKREFAFISAATNKVTNLPACRTRPPTQVPLVHHAPGQALLSTLGVLRRPATRADSLDIRALGLSGPGMEIYADGARRALSVGRTSYYIVPIHVAASGQFPSATCFSLEARALRNALPAIPATLRTATVALQAAFIDYDRRLSATTPEDGVCIIARAGNGSSTECGEPLRAIRRPIIPSNDNGTYTGVVPDGVASVMLDFPATATHAASSLTGVVHNNLFVARPPGGAPLKATGEPRVFWRAADGKVLKSLTPPSAASLENLCLNHPEQCASTMSLSSSSRSVSVAKLNAKPAGAATSGGSRSKTR